MPAPAPRRQTTSPAEEIAAALRDASHWRSEAERAFKERDEIRRSLEAKNGPAAFWRKVAGDANGKLLAAFQRMDTIRADVAKAMQTAIKFSEEADTLRGQLATTKHTLWTVWSGLEDGHPLKERLWEVWAGL